MHVVVARATALGLAEAYICGQIVIILYGTKTVVDEYMGEGKVDQYESYSPSIYSMNHYQTKD